MRTFHSFKNCANFEKFLRTKYRACHESGCLDYVNIGGITYTMHEYDNDGQSVTWANKKTGHMIEMSTEDRYKRGYDDAVVIEYQAGYLRNDIAYAL